MSFPFLNSALKRELSVLLGAVAYLKGSRLLGLGALTLFGSSLVRGYSYRDKHVFITGGSRGLGLSIAWNVLKRGGRVTLAARDHVELQRGEQLLKKDFPDSEIELCVCDVTDSPQIEQAFAQAIRSLGPIDMLVNNAGAILIGPFPSLDLSDFEAQMRLHVYAVIEATRLIRPHFLERGGGRILNICSLGGKVAVPLMLPYDASKFALAGFSQGAAAELAREGIVITTAYPTVMRTGSPIQAVFKGDHEKEFALFSTLDNLPLLSMSAQTAAEKVLDAAAEGRSEIVLSWPARLRMAAGVVLPETTQFLMQVAAALLPRGESRERKTGADSSALFRRSRALRPLWKRAQREQAVYNQRPKHDAELNLGL